MLCVIVSLLFKGDVLDIIHLQYLGYLTSCAGMWCIYSPSEEHWVWGVKTLWTGCQSITGHHTHRQQYQEQHCLSGSRHEVEVLVFTSRWTQAVDRTNGKANRNDLNVTTKQSTKKSTAQRSKVMCHDNSGCIHTRLGQTLWILFMPKVQGPCVSVHLEWRCVLSSSPFTLWRVTCHLRHWGAAQSGTQSSRQFTAQSPHPHIRKCANVSD